jgi:FtsH-binding integral membrane protein
MLSRLVCGRTIISASLLKNAIQNATTKPNSQFNIQIRKFSDGPRFRTRAERIVERPTLKERAMAPPGNYPSSKLVKYPRNCVIFYFISGPNAYGIGKGALAGGAAIGLGALCFYGLGLGSGTNTLENSHLWPQFVKTRIQDTYLYFAGSLGISAASAAAVYRSPAIMNLVSRSGWISMIATMAVMIGSGMLAQSIPYSPGFGTKQLAWAAHSAILGAVIAPICFVGGPIIMRAAWMTAGVVGGLSTVAVCAPSDKFLYMGGPLAIGLGVVFASSLAGMFLPPTTVLGAGLYSISLYGGLLLFSGFMLYDTQKIIKRAEMHPIYASRPFDPINS